MTAQQVEELALQLSADERAELVERLRESLGPVEKKEIDRPWLEEAERRDREIEEGKVAPRTADEFTRGAIGAAVGAGAGTIVGAALGSFSVMQGFGVGALSGALIGWLAGDRAEIHCLREHVAALEKERAALEAKLDDAFQKFT